MSQKSIQVMQAQDLKKVTTKQHFGAFFGKAGVYLFLILIAVIVLFPFYWMLISSIKSLY